MVKNSPANAGDTGSIPRKIPWSKKWQPTPVLLPGKLHGRKNLVSYSPWGHKRIGHNLATKKQQCENKALVFSLFHPSQYQCFAHSTSIWVLESNYLGVNLGPVS